MDISWIEPRSIAISLSNRCTSACEGCAFGSHPWVSDALSLKNAKRVLALAKEAFPRLSLCVFTGGEPLLRKKDLCRLIPYAKSMGLGTRVVSNGFWATSPAAAQRVVEELRSVGLDEINFSTGDEHARFVLLDHVLNAVSASLEQGMVVSVMVEQRRGATITPDSLLQHPVGRSLKKRYGASFIISPSPWIDVEQIDSKPSKEIVPEAALVNARNVSNRTGCKSALSDLAVQPSGDVYACCGLTLQKMPDWWMGKIWEIDLQSAFSYHRSDLLKVLIATEGPERIMAWAAGKNSKIDWENKYSHTCEVCYHLYNDPSVRATIYEHQAELAAWAARRLIETQLLFKKPLGAVGECDE